MAEFKYRTPRGFSLGFNDFGDDDSDAPIDLASLNPFFSPLQSTAQASGRARCHGVLGLR
jgi:hypothetical protein